MHEANMHGMIPDSIGRLSKLRYLSLPSNDLYGRIPASIGDVTELKHLDLTNTRVIGTVPLGIFSLPSLESLYLGGNLGLSWTIPPQIGNLTHLNRLELHSSGLHGTIPNEISHLKRLAFLSLGYNKLNGTVPNLVYTSVSQLYLQVNRFTGSVPAMNSFTGVTLDEPQIILANNSFSGDFNLPLSLLHVLELLDISNNKFTSLSSLLNNVTTPPTKCYAFHNSFGCPIPTWFANTCQATCNA
jgi:Leucine-rich repeat (LRR) protein